jgi:hypothetical protein
MRSWTIEQTHYLLKNPDALTDEQMAFRLRRTIRAIHQHRSVVMRGKLSKPMKSGEEVKSVF